MLECIKKPAERLCHWRGKTDSKTPAAVTDAPPQPQATSSNALAGTASCSAETEKYMEKQLASSEAHRVRLEQEAADLRAALQQVLRKCDAVQNHQPDVNHEENGHSSFDDTLAGEQRVARSQGNLYSRMKKYASEQLAHALANEDDMKKLLARNEADCHNFQREARRLRAALDNATQRAAEVSQTQESVMQSSTHLIPAAEESGHSAFEADFADQDSVPESDSMDWGSSELIAGEKRIAAEKRIARSEGQHCQQMTQYVCEQLAQALSNEDDTKQRLAKSEAQRRRLEEHLHACANGRRSEIEQRLDKSESRRRQLEQEVGELEQEIGSHGHQRAEGLQTRQPIDVSTSAASSSSRSREVASSVQYITSDPV